MGGSRAGGRDAPGVVAGTGKDVPALKAAAEAKIATGASRADWCKANYGMEELGAALFVGGTGNVAPASMGTPLHEFGHVVGAQAGIKDAFEKRFTAAKAKFRTVPVTWYAKSDPAMEFFAEAFALYHADPKWMEVNLADMYAWFQTLSRSGKLPP